MNFLPATRLRHETSMGSLAWYACSVAMNKDNLHDTTQQTQDGSPMTSSATMVA